MLLIKNLDLKKRATIEAIGWTLYHSFTFYPIMLIAAMMGMIFDAPINVYVGTAFVLISLLAPLSIPISLIMMWIFYFRKSYEKSRFFGRLPIIVHTMVFFLDMILFRFLK